jgi:acetyl esterase/lipase
MRHSLLAPVALLLVMHVAAAQAPPTLDVWPGTPPGETEKTGVETTEIKQTKGGRKIKIVTNVTRPTITVYHAPKDQDTGAAVLICPGGGYNVLAMDLEGEEVAAWLNSIGVTGIVLKYRVPRRLDKAHALPLMDAQRAMSMVRSHAKEWHIDPRRIGILGFSAGGHLAAATSTNYDNRRYEPIDAFDKVSCRPDFAVLVYPAYLAAKDKLAPEIRVDKNTPPTFFAHASDDRVLPENSVTMYLALNRAKVPAELHVYTNGGHGFGLRAVADSMAPTWPARCEEWLRVRGLLTKRPAAPTGR